MEQKKILLVAISVGVFLVVVIGAAILVFGSNKSSPVMASARPIQPGSSGIYTVPQPSNSGYSSQSNLGLENPTQGQLPTSAPEENPTVAQAVNDTPQIAEEVKTSDSPTVISVSRPSTAAVPDAPPAGRSSSTVNSTTRGAATASAPAQSSPAPTQSASTSNQAASMPTQAASTPAQSSPVPTQSASTPSQVASMPTQAASTPAQSSSVSTQNASTPSQAASTPSQSASAPVQAQAPSTSGSFPAQTTVVAIPAVAKTHNDYWVQTGSFTAMSRALRVKETLAAKGITSIIENRDVNGTTFFRVRVGPYTSRNEADFWLSLIKSIDGFENSQIWQSQSIN